MAWYNEDTKTLAGKADVCIAFAMGAKATGDSYDEVKSSNRSCANAFWWLYEYKHGQGEQEIRALVQKYLNNPPVQANKDDLEHQRLARIAGYWVPGRRPGVPNKPNPNKQPKSQKPSKNTGKLTVSYNTVPMPNQVPIPHPMHVSTGLSTAPEDIARLIDTSSLSTPEVWSVIVALLQSASKDSREDEHLEIIQDTIQVLYPLTQPKF